MCLNVDSHLVDQLPDLLFGDPLFGFGSDLRGGTPVVMADVAADHRGAFAAGTGLF